jgi:hypothetical protein
MAQLKKLHLQYVTDEEGRRAAVILPIVEFEELIATVKDLADVVEIQEKSTAEQAISLSQRRT